MKEIESTLIGIAVALISGFAMNYWGFQMQPTVFIAVICGALAGLLSWLKLNK